MECRLEGLCTELPLPQQTTILRSLLEDAGELWADFPSRQSPPFKVC